MLSRNFGFRCNIARMSKQNAPIISSHMLKCKVISVISLFAMLCPLVAAAGPCNLVVYDPSFTEQTSPGIHVPTFVDEVIVGMVEPDVKGYAATLTDRFGRRVATIQNGLARTSCDEGGERAFDANSKTPWGSVGKLITTAAVLKAADINGVNLDDPLENYLPHRWRNLLHTRYKYGENGSGPLTLRLLLQHRGGFRHSSCGYTARERLVTGDALQCVGDDPNPTPPPPAVGLRSYSNMSLGIFQVALAYMLFPDYMNIIVEPQANLMDDDSYDDYIQAETNSIYVSYVKTNVLNPISISGTCNMPEFKANNPKGNYTLWYSSASDSKGQLPPDQDHTCAAGGWSLTSNEIAHFLYSLRHTDSVLDREAYGLMEAGFLDSHGWHKSPMDTGLSYYHNGSWGGTKSNVRSLPGGLLVTIVANSSSSSTGELLSAIDKAFNSARRIGLSQSLVALQAPGVLN